MNVIQEEREVVSGGEVVPLGIVLVRLACAEAACAKINSP